MENNLQYYYHCSASESRFAKYSGCNKLRNRRYGIVFSVQIYLYEGSSNIQCAHNNPACKVLGEKIFFMMAVFADYFKAIWKMSFTKKSPFARLVQL